MKQQQQGIHTKDAQALQVVAKYLYIVQKNIGIEINVTYRKMV